MTVPPVLLALTLDILSAMLRLVLFAFALVSMLIRFSRRSPIHGEARPSRSSSHHAEQDPVGGLRSPRKDRGGRSPERAWSGAEGDGGRRRARGGRVRRGLLRAGGRRHPQRRRQTACGLPELRSETDRTPQGDSMWAGRFAAAGLACGVSRSDRASGRGACGTRRLRRRVKLERRRAAATRLERRLQAARDASDLGASAPAWAAAICSRASRDIIIGSGIRDSVICALERVGAAGSGCRGGAVSALGRASTAKSGLECGGTSALARVSTGKSGYEDGDVPALARVYRGIAVVSGIGDGGIFQRMHASTVSSTSALLRAWCLGGWHWRVRNPVVPAHGRRGLAGLPACGGLARPMSCFRGVHRCWALGCGFGSAGGACSLLGRRA